MAGRRATQTDALPGDALTNMSSRYVAKPVAGSEFYLRETGGYAIRSVFIFFSACRSVCLSEGLLVTDHFSGCIEQSVGGVCVCVCPGNYLCMT